VERGEGKDFGERDEVSAGLTRMMWGVGTSEGTMSIPSQPPFSERKSATGDKRGWLPREHKQDTNSLGHRA